ncbi:MAG: ABC transporter permease [Ktedonobacteraceae bacterium]|nr:ABC transporter permease [Ktedonobacteraceae bacterium]
MNQSIQSQDKRLTDSLPQEHPLESLLLELRQREQSPGNLFATNVMNALEAIWEYRARSLLMMLGMMIGVASVIGGITLGQGVGTFLDNSILSQGTTTIQVQEQFKASGGAGTKQPQPLSHRDLQSLGNLPHVAAASPVIQMAGGRPLIYGNKNWQPNSMEAVSTGFQTIQNWQVAQGFWFSQAQQTSGDRVVVLGSTTVQHLFGSSVSNPVGKQVQISGQIFRIVGVLASKGGFDLDDVVFMPYTTAVMRVLQGTNNSFFEIDVSADTVGNIDQVVQEITFALDGNHHIAVNGLADFQTITAQQQIQQEDQSVMVIGGALLGVAAISLVVAGVGIMNIMLVSVTERTREIGIRISVGARRRDIRNQFLIEALFQCLPGGLAGMLLGVVVGWLLIRVIINAAAGVSISGSIPFSITPAILIVPFVVSAGFGLIFGLYPAIRASRLDPIIALRRTK